jgi:hypothetical protein
MMTSKLCVCDAIYLYLSKELAAPEASQKLMLYRAPLRRPSPGTDFSCSNKLIKFLKIIQYTGIASLMISLSGDVGTNPGWFKIGHLNMHDLLKHLDELKILLHENPFDCSA